MNSLNIDFTTGLLMLYVATSILVGVINVIMTALSSSRTHKGKWLIWSVLGLLSIVIMLPGSYIYTIAYLAGSRRTLQPRRGSHSTQSGRVPCYNWACKGGRVYEDGISTTCPTCGGNGYM